MAPGPPLTSVLAHGWTLIANHTLLLSELLRSLNYHTAIVGKFHFNPEGGRLHRSGGRFGWGFDEQYGFTGGMSDYYNHHKSWSRNGERVSEQGYATDLFAAEAARIIDEHGTSRPNRSLFLWYSPNAPHTPMQAPAAWLDRFDSTLSPVVRTYAAMVGCMDDGFGRAVAAQRRHRAAEAVVHAADHRGVRAHHRRQRRVEAVEPRRRRLHRRCLLYTSPSPRDRQKSRMPSSA